MDTLKTLRFVQGGVATKGLLPEMKHFVIENGLVRSFNGSLALCGPIDIDIECAPLAAPLVRAIANCEDVTALSMSGTGRLKIQSGKFKAFIDCIANQDLPHVKPTGEMVDFDGEHLMIALKTLFPYIGNDAARPWCNGVLLRDSSAYATNNVCLLEYWIGTPLPFTANIPVAAVKEMIRIGEPPMKIQLDQNSISFHYDDGRWIRTQLYDTEWPDLRRVLDKQSNQKPMPADMFAALEKVKTFVDGATGRVYFRDGAIHTSSMDDDGAHYLVDDLPENGIYHIKMITLLDGVAKTADFDMYPDPVLFFGDRVRGAIIGYAQ